MIITVTLNPAIDRTLVVPNFQPGTVNRTVRSRIGAGGKGINVSKAVKSLGGDTLATGFIAGSEGRFIKDRLTGIGVTHDFVEVPGQVRTNIKIVSENGVHTDINEPGFDVTADDLDRLTKRIIPFLRKENIFVVSGVTPPNLPLSDFCAFCETLMNAGVRLIVDVPGPQLLALIPIRPHVVKPNMAELSYATGREIHDAASALESARMLIGQGIEVVLVSMNSHGAVYCTADHAFHIQPPKVEVCNPVGAGDAMVGALAMGFSEKFDHNYCARYAAAVGTASTTLETVAVVPGRKEILRIFEETEIQPMI